MASSTPIGPPPYWSNTGSSSPPVGYDQIVRIDQQLAMAQSTQSVLSAEVNRLREENEVMRERLSVLEQLVIEDGQTK